jgi:hypothetical protein
VDLDETVAEEHLSSTTVALSRHAQVAFRAFVCSTRVVTDLPRTLCCTECSREVDEFTAIAEKWATGATASAASCRFVRSCEFAPDSRASDSSSPTRRHDASRSDRNA